MVFFFKQKTAYEMRISDWSSDVCSSDLGPIALADRLRRHRKEHGDGLAPPLAGLAMTAWKRPRAATGRILSALRARWHSRMMRGPRRAGTKIGRAACRERVGQYV